MKLSITQDKKFLTVIETTEIESAQLDYSLTKKVENYFIIKKKIPSWDGDVKFIDRYGRIPVGLWHEVQKLSAKYMFNLEVEGFDSLFDQTIKFDEFYEWAMEYFDEADITPRDYQLEGAFRILKYKNCVEEISTSGGKTLIAFMLFKYLLDKSKIKKLLYIVPNVNLVTQSEDKFYEYEDKCKKRPNWKSDCAFGGSRKKEDDDINIVFGTYQTLTKKTAEYFSQFDAVCCDECHHSVAASIKSILIKCYNAEYKFGLTGTLPPEGSCSSFTIQSYIGPKVYTIHSADLISAGNATPVNVIGIEMQYLDNDTKKKLFDLRNVDSSDKDGVKLLNLEKDVVRASRKRLLYVCNMAAATTKNTLILFADIKNDYGRTVYNWLKENTEKNSYYIDGSTKNENRDYYKNQMEQNDNTIIVASTGTFSEGIDILNVHNIFILESHCSEFVIRQILGRGMRLMSGKDVIIVIDFSDNFEWGQGFQRKNYLMRHADKRRQIYKEKKFPYQLIKVDLTKNPLV